MSLSTRIGKVMPAAWIGEMASDMIGTIRRPIEVKPPLERPSDEHRRNRGGIEPEVGDHGRRTERARGRGEGGEALLRWPSAGNAAELDSRQTIG